MEDQNAIEPVEESEVLEDQAALAAVDDGADAPEAEAGQEEDQTDPKLIPLFTSITVDDLKQMIDEKVHARYIDGRGKSLFSLNHIVGFENFSFDMGPKKYAEIFDKDEPLVLICMNGSQSKQVAQVLMYRFGFTNVKVVTGGWMMFFGAGFGKLYQIGKFKLNLKSGKKKNKKK